MKYLSLILSTILLIGIDLSRQVGQSTLDQTSTKKYVYLSFDDGPLPGSDKINDAILTEKVKISVLLVGEHGSVRKNEVDLYKKNPNIEVGNHSFSHAHNHYANFYSDPQAVLQDFQNCMKELELDNKLTRLPGRNMYRTKGKAKNDISCGVEAADLLAENGFQLYGWDLEWFHDPHTAEPIGSAEKMFEEIKHHIDNKHTFTPDHLVLLCHDEMFRKDYEETELKELIELLINSGDYELRHLSEYP